MHDKPEASETEEQAGAVRIPRRDENCPLLIISRASHHRHLCRTADRLRYFRRRRSGRCAEMGNMEAYVGFGIRRFLNHIYRLRAPTEQREFFFLVWKGIMMGSTQEKGASRRFRTSGALLYQPSLLQRVKGQWLVYPKEERLCLKQSKF